MNEQDFKNYIKTGVEFVDGVYNISTVHTIDKSSWSVMGLKEKPKM
jgi:regulation of enolase protein 1 (concanavalin A-like superfamily)